MVVVWILKVLSDEMEAESIFLYYILSLKIVLIVSQYFYPQLGSQFPNVLVFASLFFIDDVLDWTVYSHSSIFFHEVNKLWDYCELIVQEPLPHEHWFHSESDC